MHFTCASFSALLRCKCNYKSFNGLESASYTTSAGPTCFVRVDGFFLNGGSSDVLVFLHSESSVAIILDELTSFVFAISPVPVVAAAVSADLSCGSPTFSDLTCGPPIVSNLTLLSLLGICSPMSSWMRYSLLGIIILVCSAVEFKKKIVYQSECCWLSFYDFY